MCNKLNSYFTKQTLLELYQAKIINYVNKTEYLHMIKHYMLKEYYKTENEIFNYISTHFIQLDNQIPVLYSESDFNKIKLYVNEFITFIKT